MHIKILYNIFKKKITTVTHPILTFGFVSLWVWPPCDGCIIFMWQISSTLNLKIPFVQWLTSGSFFHMKLCCPQRHASSTQECHWASSQYPSCWQQSACLPLRRKTGDFLSTSLSLANPQQITFLQYIPPLCILSLSHHLSSELL